MVFKFLEFIRLIAVNSVECSLDNLSELRRHILIINERLIFAAYLFIASCLSIFLPLESRMNLMKTWYYLEFSE